MSEQIHINVNLGSKTGKEKDKKEKKSADGSLSSAMGGLKLAPPPPAGASAEKKKEKKKEDGAAPKAATSVPAHNGHESVQIPQSPHPSPACVVALRLRRPDDWVTF